MALGLPFVNGNESMKDRLLSIQNNKGFKTNKIKLLSTAEFPARFLITMVCLRYQFMLNFRVSRCV